jgi:peptidoglycan/LPS O-acetylase OafA/YrhL
MSEQLHGRFGATSSARLEELDSLRGLAALGVVLYHYGLHFQVYPLELVLGPLYREAWRAVDFFFVLSGFVLCRAYWNGARERRFASNVWERVARLYPLHIVTLIAVAAGQLLLTEGMGQSSYVYHINDGYRFALNLLLLHGVDTSFNGPSWSISTEFVVNVLFFGLILLRTRWASACMIALVLITFVPSVFDAPPGAEPVSRTIRGFFFGVLLYSFVARRVGSNEHRFAGAANVLWVVTSACIVAYAYVMNAFLSFSGGITLLLCAMLVCSAPISPLGGRLLRQPQLVFLGDISYSIYLIHFPIQLVLHLLASTFGWHWPYQEAWFLALFLGLTIGCAALTYRWIELPGKRWLRSLRPRAKPAVSSEQI